MSTYELVSDPLAKVFPVSKRKLVLVSTYDFRFLVFKYQSHFKGMAVVLLHSLMVFLQNRCGFEEKGDIWVKDILNIGIS